MNISHKTKVLAIFSVVLIIAKLFSSNNFFFWDTIQLGAKHAYYYFNNGLRISFLPESIDSGHIPFFGYYLALIWKIFGKSLFVSHFAMLPFLIGIIVQLYRLLNNFFDRKNISFVMLLVLIDPSISSQLLLISPDICLLFFYLLTINASINNKNWLKIAGSIGLSFVSMRGMLALFSIFLVDLFQVFREKKLGLKTLFMVSKVYIPAGALVLLFFAAHYLEQGWFGFHNDSPWASSFELSDINEIAYNFLILGWRFLDFGRVFLWGIIIVGFVFVFRSKIFKNQKVTFFLKYFIAFVLVNLPVWVLFKSLAMHRYLLPGILLVSILTALIIQEYFKNYRRVYYVALILLLFSGNLWVYPDKISMGWDATLAHLPYYKLHANMLEYMDKNKIPIDNTGSAFPNLAESKYFYIEEDKEFAFPLYDFEENKYIFQSNIYNDFTDHELDVLANDWELLQEYKKRKVYIRLYKNPNYE